MLAHQEAHAECAQPTPECHLANGQQLLDSDPKRAASELLASYRLDERTDTLALYAAALEADHQYARALEAWQRIILFRESEIEAAKEARSAKKKQVAQQRSEEAAAAIMKLWPRVSRVRITGADGLVVTASGIELDLSKDVLVNAGSDELVFTRKDGGSAKLAIQVAAGEGKTIEAPKGAAPIAPPAEPRMAMDKPRAEVVELHRVQPKPAPVIVTKPLAPIATADGPRSRTMMRAGIAIGAAGLIGLGAAGTLAYLSHRDFDHARVLGCDSDGQC